MEHTASVHIYVDESKSKAYIVAAVFVTPGNSTVLRKLMISLLMPGQGHIHFVNERASRRKKILDSLERIEVRVRIYKCTGLKKNVEFRHVGKSEEPIVWIADAIAWSYARGGEYRRRAMKSIDSVTKVTG